MLSSFYQLAVFFFFQKLFFNRFIYLSLAALGLRCCERAFSSCGERRLLFVVVWGLLTVVASLVAEHRLQAHRLQQLWLAGFSSCGTRAQQLQPAGSRAQAQQLRRMGLVAPQHVGSSQTRARTRVPCIGRQILIHSHQGSPQLAVFLTASPKDGQDFLRKTTYFEDRKYVMFSQDLPQYFPQRINYKCFKKNMSSLCHSWYIYRQNC